MNNNMQFGKMLSEQEVMEAKKNMQPSGNFVNLNTNNLNTNFANTAGNLVESADVMEAKQNM